jgi:hypothetical protein
MGSINKRIEYLEQHIRPPEKDKDAALRGALMLDILDEVASLKASRAVHYRGGTPMVRIEPEDIPGKILGPGYTPEDVWKLARRRVLERLERHLTREEVIRAARILAGEEEEPGQ